MGYCTLERLRGILPGEIVLGANLLDRNVNFLESDAQEEIENASSIIDSYLTTIYRVPLIKWKKPTFADEPPDDESENEIYPPPIPLVCARFAASIIYDKVVMANQEPNVSEWGKNIRSLAFDDMFQIQSGIIVLPGQVYTGKRFVRRSLHDDPRTSRPGEMTFTRRGAGQ